MLAEVAKVIIYGTFKDEFGLELNEYYKSMKWKSVTCKSTAEKLKRINIIMNLNDGDDGSF